MIEQWIESGLDRPMSAEARAEVQRMAVAARNEVRSRGLIRRKSVVGASLAVVLVGGGTVTAAATGLWHWDREFAQEGTFTSRDGVRCTWGVEIAESDSNPDAGSSEAREIEPIPVHIEIDEDDVAPHRPEAQRAHDALGDDPDLVGMTPRQVRAAVDQSALLSALDEQITREVERLDLDGYKGISGWTKCD